MYQNITDIYITDIDYNPKDERTIDFVKIEHAETKNDFKFKINEVGRIIALQTKKPSLPVG